MECTPQSSPVTLIDAKLIMKAVTGTENSVNIQYSILKLNMPWLDSYSFDNMVCACITVCNLCLFVCSGLDA